MSLVVDLLRATAGTDDTTYVLSRELALVRTNHAWETFANANGGAALLARWQRGTSILPAIPEALRAFYRRGYERAWTSGERWEHDYECSSADRFRRFRMLVYPVDATFLVVVNAPLEERVHDRAPLPADPVGYAVDGVIAMCSHCRRVRDPAGVARWVWVPAYLASPPPNLSHGLCEPCSAYYYRVLDEDYPR